MTRAGRHELFSLLLAGILASSAGCGGSSRSSATTSSGGGGSTTVNNVQTVTVNTGPTAAPPISSPAINEPFTSITVCAPGSSSTCQTITGILVDTGSPGLRILSSALTISLPQQTGAGGNAVVECLPFVDGFTWGPVQTADLTIAGEQAKSLSIQVIGSATFPNIPTSCSSQGAAEDDLKSLGANGILGVGSFTQDCGNACTVTGSNNPGLYYTCSSSGCQVTTESLTEQVTNPVVLFPSDNNGVIIDLPAVTGAEASITGSLIFGIGTQSNNGLGNATVYTVDPSTGDFTTRFNNTNYTSFLDTGSNAIFFLNTAATGFPTCTDLTFFYCPTTTQTPSATNQGANGASGTFTFTVANADTLTTNAAIGVANGLAGPNSSSGTIDWGLPFFFGRKVFTAIDNQNTPGGLGPYWAY
jgi:Protein of unknown function (DUF3443)